MQRYGFGASRKAPRDDLADSLFCRLSQEEARLDRNIERRHAREKMKSQAQQVQEGNPDSPAQSVEKGGTTRKCANCGQKGHIKTNKKYACPGPLS